MQQSTHADLLDEIAMYLAALSKEPSHWYILNGSYDHAFHLSKRFGLDPTEYENLLIAANLAAYQGGQFCIMPDSWEKYLSGLDHTPSSSLKRKRNSPETPERAQRPFELSRVYIAIGGRKRTNYRFIRIGIIGSNSSATIGGQEKQKTPVPRPSHALRVAQEQFLSNTKRAIADIQIARECNERQRTMTIEEKNDDGENTITAASAITSSASTTPPRTLLNNNTATTTPVDLNVTTTTTTTTTTTAAVAAAITPHNDSTIINTSTIGQQYPALAAIFGNNFDPFQEDIQEKLHAYLTEITHILDASQAGLKVKDFGGHDVYYIRVPKAGSDKTFNNSKSWVDEALKINGAPHNGTDESAFHVSNHLCRYYPGPFITALEKQGMAIAKPMTTVQFVAMLSALHITGQKEKKLAKYLRHYLGKGFCPSQRSISILAEGHAEIFTDKVEWEYEVGERKETVAWAEKDIHSEIEIQLTRALDARKVMTPSSVLEAQVVLGGDLGNKAFQM
jgi:hypothetical protein